MSDKTQIILTAATAMFARYGYAKTTIGDIVTEAGVARQTLYNAFSSKEEILRAVVQSSGKEMYAAVMSAWEKSETVDQKLATFHELVVCALYETIQSSPDWEGLIDGLHEAAAEEMAQQEIMWRDAMSKLFESAIPPGTQTTLLLDDIVDFFHSSSMNAKYGAKNLEHLKRRLAAIRLGTNALLHQ